MSEISIITQIYPTVGMGIQKLGSKDPQDEPSKSIQKPGPISPPISASEIKPKDLHQTVSKIDKLLRQGKFLNALILAKNALRIYKDDPSILVKLGEVCLLGQKLDVAQKHFELAKQINPNLIDAYLGLASIETVNGNYDKVLAIYEEALGIDPVNTEANFYKGQILFNRGKYEEAKEVFAKAKESALRNIAQGKNDLDSHMILGMIYKIEGDYNSAVEQFETLYHLEPNNVDNSVLLGNIYEELGNLEKALTIYQRTIDAGSEDTSVWIGLARTKYAFGGKENFRETFDIYGTLGEFVSLNAWATAKEKSDFCYEQGSINHIMGQYEKAIQLLEIARKIDPRRIDVLELLAQSYLTLSKYEEALSITEEILKQQSANRNALIVKMNCYFNLAMLHQQNGSMSRAEQYRSKLLIDLKSAEELFSKNLEILKALKDVYSRMGEYEKAREYLEKIIGLMPEDLSDTSGLRRELANIDMYLARTEGRDFSFDNKKVNFLRLKDFKPLPPQEKYEIGDEFNNFIESSVGETGYYYVDDEDNLRKRIEIKLKHGFDLRKLSAREAIELAAKLTESNITYDDKTALADLPHVPIEAKISDGNGVCRNYVPVFNALFNTIKSVNPNLTNIYVAPMTNSNHAWNVIFEVRLDRIIAVPIDLTYDDVNDDPNFGDNLEALDDDHFHRFDQVGNHEVDPQRAIDEYEKVISRFSDAKWVDTARLNQAKLYFVQGKYKEAQATLDSILKDHPQTERLAEVYHLLGVIELQLGNLSAAIGYLEKELGVNISSIRPGTKIILTLIDEKNTPVLPAEARIEMKIIEKDGRKGIKTKIFITNGQIEKLRKRGKLEKINLSVSRSH